MSQLERVVEASTLDPTMRELIKLRASQINGCAYCVDMTRHFTVETAVGGPSRTVPG